MATVQTILNNARYDLGDFGGQKWDDTQLLHYMNRVVPILDDALISLNSDYTKTTEAVTLSSGSNTATLPTRCDTVVQLWQSTDLWLKEPLEIVMYRYQINNSTSTTGKPQYWAHNKTNFYFNVEADANYSLTAVFHQKSATLTISDSMPYNDAFNEYLREAVVTMAQKAKDNQIPGIDQQFYSTFRMIAMRYVISRTTKYKNYFKDF